MDTDIQAWIEAQAHPGEAPWRTVARQARAMAAAAHGAEGAPWRSTILADIAVGGALAALVKAGGIVPDAPPGDPAASAALAAAVTGAADVDVIRCTSDAWRACLRLPSTTLPTRPIVIRRGSDTIIVAMSLDGPATWCGEAVAGLPLADIVAVRAGAAIVGTERMVGDDGDEAEIIIAATLPVDTGALHAAVHLSGFRDRIRRHGGNVSWQGARVVSIVRDGAIAFVERSVDGLETVIGVNTPDDATAVAAMGFHPERWLWNDGRTPKAMVA